MIVRREFATARTITDDTHYREVRLLFEIAARPGFDDVTFTGTLKADGMLDDTRTEQTNRTA